MAGFFRRLFRTAGDALDTPSAITKELKRIEREEEKERALRRAAAADAAYFGEWASAQAGAQAPMPEGPETRKAKEAILEGQGDAMGKAEALAGLCASSHETMYAALPDGRALRFSYMPVRPMDPPGSVPIVDVKVCQMEKDSGGGWRVKIPRDSLAGFSCAPDGSVSAPGAASAAQLEALFWDARMREAFLAAQEGRPEACPLSPRPLLSDAFLKAETAGVWEFQAQPSHGGGPEGAPARQEEGDGPEQFIREMEGRHDMIDMVLPPGTDPCAFLRYRLVDGSDIDISYSGEDKAWKMSHIKAGGITEYRMSDIPAVSAFFEEEGHMPELELDEYGNMLRRMPCAPSLDEELGRDGEGGGGELRGVLDAWLDATDLNRNGVDDRDEMLFGGFFSPDAEEPEPSGGMDFWDNMVSRPGGGDGDFEPGD